MKKIVAFLLPVPDVEPGSGTSCDPFCSIVEQSPPVEALLKSDGAMRMEAIVDDSQAHRIVSALMGRGSGNDAGASLKRLLETELDAAGPDAHNLFERIVVGVERELISQVYHECDGVKTRTAARLGINRNTLHKKLRQYNLAEE